MHKSNRYEDINPTLRMGMWGSVGALAGGVAGVVFALLAGVGAAVPLALVTVGALGGIAAAPLAARKHERQTQKHEPDNRVRINHTKATVRSQANAPNEVAKVSRG